MSKLQDFLKGMFGEEQGSSMEDLFAPVMPGMPGWGTPNADITLFPGAEAMLPGPTLPFIMQALNDPYISPVKDQGAQIAKGAMPQVPSRSADIGTVAKVAPSDIYTYLRQKGVSHNHAVGMLPNIQAESGFDPHIKEKGVKVGGVGLFQHTGPRRRALYKAHGVDDISKIPWQSQVDYALAEPDTKRYLSKQFANPAQASHDFTVNWERPANKHAKARQRLKYLKTLEKLVMN